MPRLCFWGGDLRGFLCWGSAAGFTAFNPPNAKAPDMMTQGVCNVQATWNLPCTSRNRQQFPRSVAARSLHSGSAGVNVGFRDGHPAGISNNISTGVPAGARA
jgi:hypothetical protein